MVRFSSETVPMVRDKIPSHVRKRIEELIKEAEAWEGDKNRMATLHPQATPLIEALDPHGGARYTWFFGCLQYLWEDCRVSQGFGFDVSEEIATYHASLGFLRNLLVVGEYTRVTSDPRKIIARIRGSDESRISTYEDSPFYETRRDYEEIPDTVFVIMPFAEQWSDRIWRDHIKRYVMEFEPRFNCIRADNLFGQDVMKDIFRSLVQCRLIIAETTSRNPNVFYELGMCHAMGRNVVLLTQNAKDIPFDLLRFRHCVYEDNSQGHLQMKFFIQNVLREIEGT